MPTPVLDLAFAALSDPTRREIVQRLAKGAARVTDLAQPFDMSFNAVSKHVKVLERAGLVRRPRLLEFTWMSEATRGLESRVTVEMTPSRGATDLVLTHNGLPDDEIGRGHEEGWKHFTGILAEKIKGLR